MNFYKEAKEAVEFILANSDLKQEDISIQAGYKEQSLTQFLSANYVSERAYKNIKREFANILNKSINVEKDNKKEVKVKKPNKKPTHLPMDQILEQLIVNLTESNKQLVETVKKQTEVHLVEAEVNRFLAQTNYGIMQKITNSDNSKGDQQESSSPLVPVIARMAKNALNHPELWKKWETQAEGEEVLDKLLAFYPEGNQKDNKRNHDRNHDSGKENK